MGLDDGDEMLNGWMNRGLYQFACFGFCYDDFYSFFHGSSGGGITLFSFYPFPSLMMFVYTSWMGRVEQCIAKQGGRRWLAGLDGRLLGSILCLFSNLFSLCLSFSFFLFYIILYAF